MVVQHDPQTHRAWVHVPTLPSTGSVNTNKPLSCSVSGKWRWYYEYTSRGCWEYSMSYERCLVSMNEKC